MGTVFNKPYNQFHIKNVHYFPILFFILVRIHRFHSITTLKMKLSNQDNERIFR